MTQTCPLCGKTKPGTSLFCSECTHRIRADYEVELPEAPLYKEPRQMAEADKTRGVPKQSNVPFEIKPEKSKRFRTPLLILLVVLLLGGGYMVYMETIHKRNSERSGWDKASNMNSVEGYLEYIAVFPRGAHSEEAQKELLRLKSEETMKWKQLKASDNTAELRDFLNQHPDIPFAPLVEKRLDSLSWAGVLRANTPEAYTEYMHLSRQGKLRGDYVTEARAKYDELLSARVQVAVTDSLFE